MPYQFHDFYLFDHFEKIYLKKNMIPEGCPFTQTIIRIFLERFQFLKIFYIKKCN